MANVAKTVEKQRDLSPCAPIHNLPIASLKVRLFMGDCAKTHDNLHREDEGINHKFL
jgi:hypothetical protein